MQSLEFLLGLLDRQEPARVAWDDFAAIHGPALRTWQRMGFLSQEGGQHPIASCPHCDEGVPYRLRGRLICHWCRSEVDPSHLLLWQLDREAFLHWLAGKLSLRGGVRRIDDRLWQLGTWENEASPVESFYRRPGPLSETGRARLSAYRNVLVFSGVQAPVDLGGCARPCVALIELLRLDDTLAVADLATVLRPRGNVRFDAHSGALWVGETFLGEIPVGSKEYFFLSALASQLDHFVSYADLKYEILRRSGSSDETEEATFCHNLKSRIKKRWMGKIDQLLATTNKGDGYRLRGYAESC